MNDVDQAWLDLFGAKREYDQAFAILPDGWLTVEQRRTSARVQDAQTAVEKAIREPLESRLEAYETAVEEYLTTLDDSRPLDRRLPSHTDSFEARLRELSGQPGGSRG